MDDFLVDFVNNIVVEASAATMRRHKSTATVDPFDLPDFAFRKHYRLSKELASNLIQELDPLLEEKCIPNKTKIFCTLQFLGTGSYQHPVGSNYLFDLSQPSVSRCIEEVVAALNHSTIFNKWVHFPQSYREMNGVVQGFFAKYHFPGVVGAIDCTHIAIVPPSNRTYDERAYVNRKNFHSIYTQLICEVNLKILNVCAIYPGSSHDSYIFNNSNVSLLMEQLHDTGHQQYHLIGDSGYALRPWMMTPLVETTPNTPEDRYNDTQKKMRATVERCNGVIKQRFRCLLKDRVLHYTPQKANKIINACVVLHNMCVEAEVPLPPNSGENITEEQLGMLPDRPPPALPPNSRTNRYLNMGRTKQTNIINQYFN